MAILANIHYEGDNKTFVWKSPIEDFSLGSSLTVNESQEALFFANGQACDLFAPGRYTLQTQNIPILGKLLNLAYGGETPFHCSVYFINKTEQLAIKWGTDSKIEYIDPEYNFPLKVGMSGEMSLKVDDARKLIVKLVGTEELLSQEKLTYYFRGFLLNRIKPYIAQIMREERINIFQADEKLEVFSEALQRKVSSDFNEYGLELTHFFVTNFVKPEGEHNYEHFKDLFYREHLDNRELELQNRLKYKEREAQNLIDLERARTEAEMMRIKAQASADKRSIEGYTYQQEQSFDVAKKVAENEAAGQFTNMGIGLGTMAGVGGAVGGMLNNTMQTAMNAQPVTSPAQAQPPVQEQTAASDPMVTLQKMKQLLDMNLITQEQYDKKVEEVLERM